MGEAARKDAAVEAAVAQLAKHAGDHVAKHLTRYVADAQRLVVPAGALVAP